MKFTWDDKKEQKNIEKHGLGFDLAEAIIYSPDMRFIEDTRKNYGEQRHIAYTVLEGIRFSLVYVIRDDEYRIISLRRVHEREWRKNYGDS